MIISRGGIIREYWKKVPIYAWIYLSFRITFITLRVVAKYQKINKREERLLGTLMYLVKRVFRSFSFLIIKMQWNIITNRKSAKFSFQRESKQLVYHKFSFKYFGSFMENCELKVWLFLWGYKNGFSEFSRNFEHLSWHIARLNSYNTHVNPFLRQVSPTWSEDSTRSSLSWTNSRYASGERTSRNRSPTPTPTWTHSMPCYVSRRLKLRRNGPFQKWNRRFISLIR